MAKQELDNLVRIGNLKAEAASRNEFDGMVKSARRGLADAQNESIAGLRQQAIEELDITGMEFMIEFVVTGVVNDQDAAFFEQRLVAVEIEVITETHHLDEQWIQD